MGCAGSVPNNLSLVPTDLQEPSASRKKTEQQTSPPAFSLGDNNNTATNNNTSGVEAKYFKEKGDGASLFCDDDGCGTVVTASNDHIEDDSSAHRYVDFVARERRSIAHSASEPSAFATAISHKYRMARAYVKYGITGDCEQYQEEVDRAVPTFSARAKRRVWEWLRSVEQAPPRGTRLETIKLFKRVQRGSVISLGGNNQPDIRKVVSLGRVSAHTAGVESKSGHLKDTGGAEDVLDELLMVNSYQNVPIVGDGSFRDHSRSNPNATSPTNVVDEAPFALPENLGLVANSLAVGTVIGVDGDDNQYDLVVVEEVAEVIDDEVIPESSAAPQNEGFLSPHTYASQQYPNSSSSHRETASSVNSRDRFDYMSVSQHSSLPQGGEPAEEGKESDKEILGVQGGVDSISDPAVRQTGRGVSQKRTSPIHGKFAEEDELALEEDPIMQRIHDYNNLVAANSLKLSQNEQ